MPNEITITIPFDIARVSHNAIGGLHWAQIAKRRKPAYRAARLAYLKIGEPSAKGPVILDVHVRRVKAMDDDNIASGLKPFIDALCREKVMTRPRRGPLKGMVIPGAQTSIVPDDSNKWLSLGSLTQETGLKFKLNPELVLTFRPRDEAGVESLYKELTQ